MTAPAIHAAGLRTALDELTAQIEIEQTSLRHYGLSKKRDFIDSGLRYHRFRGLLEQRNALLPEEERISLNAWVEDPDNHCDSGVLLSVQTIDVFHVYFKLPPEKLIKVGRAKFGELCPEMECWIRDIARGKRTYEDGQAAALDWINEAETKTRSALHDDILFKSIAYSGDDTQNATEGTTARHSGRYETMLDNEPKQVAYLRQMTKEDLLSLLGAAQMRDDEFIYIRTTRPKPRDLRG